MDYQYERKAKDMMKFAARHMPNYVERVSGVDGMQAYEAKVKPHNNRWPPANHCADASPAHTKKH